MQPDEVPLTPAAVDGVTFDRAPLGRRGYHENQVDTFLDRVRATLSGTDALTARDVREVMFDSAPLIRRGYHEDQVDDFLDRVEAELERRARPPRPAPPPAPPRERPPGPAQGPPPGNPPPAADAGPPSPPLGHPFPDSTMSADPHPPQSDPNPHSTAHTGTHPHQPPQSNPYPESAIPTGQLPDHPFPDSPVPASPIPDSLLPERPPELPVPDGPAQSLLDAWRDTNLLALPIPPAPPSERGYRPGDVERLVTLLATAATEPDGRRADEVAGFALTRTFFIGQGYHVGAVEALRLAWVTELRRREL